MRQPLVTIVTPSFNQGRFIRATIDSVLNQDYPDIEYIIMDGGSTDETAAVVEQYASRLTWISERDRGQSHAVNKGFQMARGEIVAWLNSDDILLPGAVRHAVEALARRPEAGAVYGEGFQIDEHGDRKGRFPWTEPFNLWKLVFLWDYILQQTVFFRRSVVAEVGWLDESLNWSMDWDLLIRIGSRYRLAYIPEYLGCLREHGEAKTFSGGVPRFRELTALMRRNTGKRYPPGYFVYGYSTYEPIWSSKLDSWLLSPVRTALRVAGGLYISHIVRFAQGWYPDGWAAPRVQIMLPSSATCLRVIGSVSAGIGGRTAQRICLSWGGQTVACKTLPPGDFSWEIPLPQGNAERPWRLELRAARSTLSIDRTRWFDSRRLAYQLKTIDFDAGSHSPPAGPGESACPT